MKQFVCKNYMVNNHIEGLTEMFACVVKYVSV